MENYIVKKNTKFSIGYYNLAEDSYLTIGTLVTDQHIFFNNKDCDDKCADESGCEYYYFEHEIFGYIEVCENDIVTTDLSIDEWLNLNPDLKNETITSNTQFCVER